MNITIKRYVNKKRRNRSNRLVLVLVLVTGLFLYASIRVTNLSIYKLILTKTYCAGKLNQIKIAKTSGFIC